MTIKKKLFYIILFLIPFVILSAVELGLRLAGYANDLNIVSTIERNGINYYTMNQLVGKRYFGKDRLYYRKGVHDYFEVNKSPNTIRIFLFGESTTAGFPYEYNAIPSEFLRNRLVNAFPGKRIEVINTAIAATNSFTVVEFVKELVHYKPDLFIFYMGQNEFYGVYGVGSTISIGKNRGLIKTYLWLQQFKTFILLNNFINSVSSLFSSSDQKEDQILMEQMAKNNFIEENSSDYNIALNTFRENYEEAIKIAKENNIPVITSTLVTNEKDLHPFVSLHSGNFNSAKRNKYIDLYNSGINSEKNNDYTGAIKYYKKALEMDKEPANTHFELAQCYLKMQDYVSAEKEFTSAKDLDGLRFRAPSVFNLVIKDLSKKYKVPVADVNRIFRDYSENRIIGNELLTDHVHPNIKGYFLMAKSWFGTISDNKLLAVSNGNIEDDSLLWHNLPVTRLDSLIGELKIMELKSKPPFTDRDEDLNFISKDFIDDIAYQYTAQHQFSWGEAHFNAAKGYLSRNDLPRALKEYKAILVTDDENPYILTTEGDLYVRMELYSEAEKSYLRAVSFSDNPYIKYKLGIAELNLNKLSLSVQLLNDCLNGNETSYQKLNPVIIKDIRYNLALAYIKTKEYPKAASELNYLLRYDSTDERAKALLQKVNPLVENK